MEIAAMRVAHMDDQSFLRERVKTHLESRDIILSMFSHPEHLIEAIRQGESFDIIVSDRFGQSFDTVAQKLPRVLRKKYKYCGILILYSSALEQVEENVSGFDLAVPKSVDITPQMLRAVQQAYKSPPQFTWMSGVVKAFKSQRDANGLKRVINAR